MTYRNDLRFLLNDQAVRVTEVNATDTLLDYLRLQQRMTGTKEGCAEGDCGACTVLVGRLSGDELVYEPVNACIRFMASLDGCHIVTIEHLAAKDGELHPIQKAIVDHHASQCGFCTPGIVMSLYALWMQNPSPTKTDVEVALQGNLCRCTGYAPIIKAAISASQPGGATNDPLMRERDGVRAKLRSLRIAGRVDIRNAQSHLILPADVDDLANVLAENPDATIVAGATDVGLWVTKFLRPIQTAVFIGHLDGLKQITVDERQVTLGAGVTYSQARDVMATTFPHLAEFWDRIAGWQVRNMGTIGGNIANGSPIGDIPPVLIALGATIELRVAGGRRSLPLEDFFIAYGKQDIAPGEFVESITIPIAQGVHGAYKISKRRDEDISSVCVGFNLTVTKGQITEARVAFGGMAATPKRATCAEAALVGQPWSEGAFSAAAQALSEDFTPLSDMRATADYRMTVARNLFQRFYLENSGDLPVRLKRA